MERRESASHDVPANMRGLASIPSEYARIPSEVPVIVLADNTDLKTFVENVFNTMEAFVATKGGTMPVTETELLHYFVTAMKVRVQRTTLPRLRKAMRLVELRTEEPWALPVEFAYVLASVGQAKYGPTNTLIYPVWDEGADDMVLTESEQNRITTRLRALEPYGFRYASAIESRTEGVLKVMVLTWLPDAAEGHQWVANEPFSALDAATASTAGLRSRANYPSPENPLWIPPYRVGRQQVVRIYHDFSTLVVGSVK